MMRSAQAVLNPVPVSVVEVPPVAVPAATPLSMVMVEPTKVIAISQPLETIRLLGTPPVNVE
jgi:hypothetical protein